MAGLLGEGEYFAVLLGVIEPNAGETHGQFFDRLDGLKGAKGWLPLLSPSNRKWYEGIYDVGLRSEGFDWIYDDDMNVNVLLVMPEKDALVVKLEGTEELFIYKPDASSPDNLRLAET